MPTGHISFTDGQVPTTNEWNGRISEQVVGYYATTAARNNRVTAPSTGMISCIAGRLEWYNGSSWVAVSPNLARVDTAEEAGTSWWGTGFTLPPTGLLTILFEDDATTSPFVETWHCSCARVRGLPSGTSGTADTAQQRMLLRGGTSNIYVGSNNSNELLITESSSLGSGRWEFWI